MMATTVCHPTRLRHHGARCPGLRGGDTLKVLPGQYFVAPLSIDDLGSTPDKPVWILAEQRDAATLSAAWEEAATGRVEWRKEGDGSWSRALRPEDLWWLARSLSLPLHESCRPAQSPGADDRVCW